MPRHLKKQKKYIVVFCEGESEQAYTKFLRNRFKDVAVFKCHTSTGLFEEADRKFSKDKSYRDNAEVTDEIWFVFDVEMNDVQKWDQRLKIIKKLRALRKKPNIRVRLLMTTGCVEYWLLLHYKMLAPPIRTVAEKQHIIDDLIAIIPDYKKGDDNSISEIAPNYPVAVKNATNIFQNLLQDGLPGLEDSDERNRWLCKNSVTFSTVYEAIDFLTNL